MLGGKENDLTMDEHAESRNPDKVLVGGSLKEEPAVASNITTASEGCKCAGPCGAHQGADFGWCPVGDCTGLKADPTLTDHSLYKTEAVKNNKKFELGAFMSVGEGTEPVGGAENPEAGAEGEAGGGAGGPPKLWDYCLPKAIQLMNYYSPGTAHLGCQCGMNREVLAKYDPATHPQYRILDPKTGLPKPPAPGKGFQIDLKKIPFRDRFAVQIMGSKLDLGWFEEGVLENPKLCQRVPDAGNFTVCPVDPLCKMNRTEHRSPWFDTHSWDFCTHEGWDAVGVFAK